MGYFIYRKRKISKKNPLYHRQLWKSQGLFSALYLHLIKGRWFKPWKSMAVFLKSDSLQKISWQPTSNFLLWSSWQEKVAPSSIKRLSFIWRDSFKLPKETVLPYRLLRAKKFCNGILLFAKWKSFAWFKNSKVNTLSFSV